MNDRKNRILLFALGASMGVLAGGAVVYFSSVKNSKDKVSENFIEDIANRVASLLSSKTEEKQEDPEKPQKKQAVPANERKTVEAVSPKDSVEADTPLKNETDSIHPDTAAVISVENEEIIVKKDALLSTASVDMINLALPDKRQQHSDSLVQAATGLKDENKFTAAKYTFSVEYWQSPVNYKGYKLGKGKLVLFGIEPGSATKMYYLNDATYLYFKQQDAYYRLDYSNDFKAFERVTNNAVLSQLQLNK